jgi:hypothetical protein
LSIYTCGACGKNTADPPPDVWPPAQPIKLSVYGLVVKRGPRGSFSVERTGGSLSHYDLDIGSAIGGGCPVDKDDPGWQYDRGRSPEDPAMYAALAEDL